MVKRESDTFASDDVLHEMRQQLDPTTNVWKWNGDVAVEPSWACESAAHTHTIGICLLDKP